MAIPQKDGTAVVPSSLTEFIRDHTPAAPAHPKYLHHLALQILHNLEYQHRWTELHIHILSPTTKTPLPRPLISGLPPKRLYVHPDEQIELLELENKRKKEGRRQGNAAGAGAGPGADDAASVEGEPLHPEREWVLPTHLAETWSVSRFAEMFDAISTVPPSSLDGGVAQVETVNKWRITKRMVLGTLQDDSTVVYYIVHDGIVKPRQN